MTECEVPCTGDADVFCGGVHSFQIFSTPAGASLGHLGCYADRKDDRLFKAGKVDLEENGVEASPVVQLDRHSGGEVCLMREYRPIHLFAL